MKRGLSLSGFPYILRQGDGSKLSEISRLPTIHIRNAIKQLKDAKEAGGSFRILNNALEGCKIKITTLPNQGDEEIRRCGDFADEYGRGLKQSQRREFRKQVWEGILNYMAEEIQHLVPMASQEALDELRFSCEHFRNEAGAQLNQLKDVKGKIVGVANLAKTAVSN